MPAPPPAARRASTINDVMCGWPPSGKKVLDIDVGAAGSIAVMCEALLLRRVDAAAGMEVRKAGSLIKDESSKLRDIVKGVLARVRNRPRRSLSISFVQDRWLVGG
jgi:hypothetical protein